MEIIEISIVNLSAIAFGFCVGIFTFRGFIFGNG